MYERRQSFCEFGAKRRQSTLVPVVIATLRRATSAEYVASPAGLPGGFRPGLSARGRGFESGFLQIPKRSRKRVPSRGERQRARLSDGGKTQVRIWTGD